MLVMLLTRSLSLTADKPRVELRVDPLVDLREVEEGEDVTFFCHIDAHPPVTGVQWAHDVSVFLADDLCGTA